MVSHDMDFSKALAFCRILKAVYYYLFLHRSVTLERFFVVVYPLKKFRMKKFLLPIVAAFSLLYNLPKVSKQLKWEKGFLSV